MEIKTDELIAKQMDEAESEINAVLEKYGLVLGMLYDEGGFVTLSHYQQHPSGEHSFMGREFDGLTDY